jgi:hypothetical protein
MTDGLEEMGLPPIGHNAPPEPTAIERTQALVDNCNRWLAERPEITDPEMAGAAQRFTIQLRALRDDLAAALKADRKPFDDAIEVLKFTYRDPQELVRIALDTMELKNRQWLKREQDRLDAERVERERQADAARYEAQEAEQLAQAPGASVETQLAAQRARDAATEAVDTAARTPTKARVRDDYAPRAMSLHSRWKARVIDETAALKHYAKHPDIRAAALAAIVKVATKLAKDQKGKPPIPPGVEFWNDERAT